MATSNNNFLPSQFQEYIYLSRYSRWLEDKKRREHFSETVDRYFAFFDEHLAKTCNGFALDKSTKKELINGIFNLDYMPSMRCMMTAGEALKRENVAGYNCLAAETLVTTKEYGHLPIRDLLDRKISIINSDGEWSETVVRSYGEKPLHKVSFRYGTSRFMDEVYATDSHDWYLSDGRKIKTVELQKGMVIPTIIRKREKDYSGSEDYKLGVMHGLVYGDGTKLNKTNSNRNKISNACKRDKGYVIRICSDHEDTLKYFDGYRISYPKTYNSDPVVYMYDDFAATHRLKELPDNDESEAYLVGFFRGWLAADGCVSKTGQVTMCVGPDEENWLRKTMPTFGVHFGSSYQLPKNTNLGERSKPSRTLFVWRPSLTVDDILLSRKRSRFKPIVAERRVHEVIPTNRVEEVFCVEVPKYRNFTIGNGILTGNCSYVTIDTPRAFDEILYVLMCGAGVGFSVESKYIEKLPVVAEDFSETDTTIVVHDSRAGWAKGLREMIQLLYVGQIPKWDVSRVRPKGSRLKTFGGRASGPEPLVNLFKFCVATFKKAAGRRLTSLECHDIACKVGEIVVVGGVRRSAMISLSDLSDDRMRHAKSGNWWKEDPQRALANNSYVTKEKVDIGTFMREWLALYESKSGERGIFSRYACQIQAESSGRRDPDHEFGTNPCCLSGDTKVWTEELGIISIKKLVGLVETGQKFKVMGYDIRAHQDVYTKVLGAKLTRPNAEMLTVVFKSGSGRLHTLNLTPDHPVYVKKSDHESVYVNATDLKVDDLAYTIGMFGVGFGRVTSIANYPNEDTYDIQTETKNFFANNVLVHNSEIILRPSQFCNLTEAVIRAEDTIDTIKKKVGLATIIGTIQSTLTNFKYISKEWKNNCDEERLLGVSLTGITDNQYTNGKFFDSFGDKSKEKFAEFLESLKNHAVATNESWAAKMGIPASTAVTCVKPSGCRPAESLITTDEGIYTLEEMMLLHDDDSEWCDVSKHSIGVGEAGKITKTYINGKSETLKINLNYGMSVVSTPNHKWWVEDKGWVRTDEICEGDVLNVQPNNYNKTSDAHLKPLNKSAFSINDELSIDMIQPKTVNADIAWLLGYLWGDGAMSPTKYRLRWCDNRIENLQKAKRVLKEQFNLDSSVGKASQGRNAHNLTVASKLLWHWLIKNDVWKYKLDSSIDCIPSAIRKSSKESIIAFIAGLYDADGCYGSNQRVMLTQCDEKFVDHLQHVSWSVGLCFGKSHNVGGTNKQEQKSMYLMKLGLHSDNMSLDLLKKHSNKITGDFDIRGSLHKNRQNLRPGLVKSVVSNGAVDTYDVETEQHWFMAGSIKSHNTVSQLVNSASGIHPRYSEFYIRTVRANKADPLAIMMKDMGFPAEDDVNSPDDNYVFSFPVQSPAGAMLRDDMTAIEQLELWLMYYRHYCEHKPSITVYVRENEWMKVGDWVYQHMDEMSGVSFLPYSEHMYRQAPYQEISESEYKSALEQMPKSIDWTKLVEYEKDDAHITAMKEYACTSGACELV